MTFPTGPPERPYGSRVLEPSRHTVQQGTALPLMYGVHVRQLDVRPCEIHPSRYGHQHPQRV
ncbi:hypothetical protein [Streptomyces sp. WAC05292]|uniref:hypothetical protein n=1 Tax=Streptomyces sp. WAC05292 TaxID=2487418 RepID=UPI0021AF5B50|nr:hypothetical protein [Streptomyces sp. WAC05292]